MTYQQVLEALRAGRISWYDALQQLTAIFGPGGAVPGPAGSDAVGLARQFLEQNGFAEPGVQGPDLGQATGGEGLPSAMGPFGTTAEEGRTLQEATEPFGVFRRFLGTTPGLSGVAPQIRESLMDKYQDLLAQFRTLPGPTGTLPGGMEVPTQTFENFLRAGQLPGVEALSGGLRNLMALFNRQPGAVPESGFEQAARNIFDPTSSGGLANIFRASVQPALKLMSPAFQNPFLTSAWEGFQQQRAQRPEANPFALFSQGRYF